MSNTHETDAAGTRTLDTKESLARFLGVTTRTVEHFQRRGLPYYRLGPRRNRYDRAAVLAWLEKGGAK